METKELLLTSSEYTQNWSACLWDYTTSNTLHCYRNGSVVAPRTLTLLGTDYLLGADAAKPLLHLWPMNSQEPSKKFNWILPGPARVLTVCPKTAYLVAAIDVTIYIWHLSSGKLLTIIKRNYQPINCVKFSNCGGFLVIGAQEGMLTTYNFTNLISSNTNLLTTDETGQIDPIYTRNDNSLPIVDVHVGNFGRKSRVAVVSLDQTCKIYALQTGQLLVNLIFNEPLTCVLFDQCCWNLYVGTQSGLIRHFHMKSPPRRLDHHVTDDDVKAFKGHQKHINCMDLNLTNTILASGSNDYNVFIWEINSRQILKRIEHKDAITNIKFVLNHDNFFNINFKPKLILKGLNRHANYDYDDFIVATIQDYDLEFSDDEDNDESKRCDTELEGENRNLKSINKQLYDAALQLLTKQS